MGLLRLDNKNNIIIDVHCLLVKELNEVYKRDNTPNKKLALMEFKYIYYLCDPNSSGIKRGLTDKKLEEEAIEEELDENQNLPGQVYLYNHSVQHKYLNQCLYCQVDDENDANENINNNDEANEINENVDDLNEDPSNTEGADINPDENDDM